MANAERLHVPPELVAKGREVMPAARKNIARAFGGGVKVAFGTDAAVYPHGLNAHEFAVMVHLGLTPLQSIQAATINAADLLGWSDKVGAVRSFTFDYFAGSPSPPLVASVIDVEGARLYLQMTDVHPQEVKLDLPVELTFRKMHEAGGTPNYYWKCTPVR